MHMHSHIFSQLYSTINLKLPQVLLIKWAALQQQSRAVHCISSVMVSVCMASHGKHKGNITRSYAAMVTMNQCYHSHRISVAPYIEPTMVLATRCYSVSPGASYSISVTEWCWFGLVL